jgi:lipopolysaccharide export system permease protein
MGSIGRYIFRTTFGVFLVVLIGLTAVIWVTQALRDIDLITSQGQTILTFIGITSLIIPFLIMTIAPIALIIAVTHVLNKLSTDSEIIVMSAAGMSPWLLLRAFLSVAFVVSLIVCVIGTYFGPKGLRMLRDWVTKVHAQVVTTVVQPGRFTTIQSGVTFHIRERHNNGQLSGVFLDDRRNPNERITIIAELGELLENENGTFLIFKNGVLQRQQTEERDPATVLFDRYAFDLSQFAGGAQAANYSIRERYLWQLIFADPDDRSYIEQPGRFRAELHDRLLGPLYPLAFVIIALAYLTAPRTTRQSRVLSIVYVIGWAALLRIIGVISNIFGVTTPWTLSLPYVAITIVLAFGLFVIHTGAILETPAFLGNWLAIIGQRNRARVAAK